MDALGMLLTGFAKALSPINLAMSGVGAIIGTLVGVLPGLGPTSAIAILLPLTAVLEPTQAIIMLAGIYYGSMYGGSTTAILLNIPGEVSSVPTCLDGYPLAKKGRGGPALGIAAISSFAAGLLGIIGLVFFAPLLADQALKFGPPEYFALMILALSVIINLAGNSITKALIMGVFGYLISLVGLGPTSGMPRFDYGVPNLIGGFEMISIVIGLFAVCEVLKGLEEKQVSISAGSIGSVYPSINDWLQSWKAMLRGSALGFVLGLLPGCSPAVTTFLSYDIEKKISKHPEAFGTGVMEGVAAPEAANNGTSQSGFIPLLALGIPASPALAVLLAGLMMYGLAPGPTLFQEQGEFVWTIIASMFIGNLMLLVLNLPLIKLWAKITQIPYGILGPIILILSILGSYTVRNSMFDVFVSLVFGILGYLFYKYRWPVVPLILSYILGPMLESSFVQSMAMENGNPFIFFQRPISGTIMVMVVILLIVSIKLIQHTKKRVAQEVGTEADISS